MRFALAFALLFPVFHFGQMKFKFKQYMLHQTIYNPGYVDPETRFSVNTLYRRQWLRQENYPEAFFVYGHYNFEDGRHAVAGIMSNDLINKYNQFEFSANYVYNIPVGYDYNLGLGIKAGFIEQNLLNTNLTYFDPDEPVLADGNFTTHFFNLGTGISFTSRDLSLHFGVPQLFGNRFINDQEIYNVKNAHLFFNAGYKFHKTDWFIVYPNIMMYAVRGSKFHGSFHLNFLASQLVWGGFGVDSEQGRVNLELKAPQSEYRELHKQWEELWKDGQKDEKTNTVISLPIEEAKKKLLEENPKAGTGDEAQKALEEAQTFVSYSSAGRTRTDRRR